MVNRVQVAVVVLASISSVIGACSSDDDGTTGTTTPGGSEADCPADGEEWEVAKVYIEHNATDEDTGFHGFFGGEPWRNLCVTDPDGERIWEVTPRGQLGALGVSDIFFESNEPPNDEYSPEDLKADFPEGTYVVAGVDTEGIARVGEAVFTHAIPAEPEIVEPVLAEDEEEAEGAVVPRSGLVVMWEPVTESIDGGPVTVTGYEVIVTDEETEDPAGFARPVYDVHVRADTSELAVPNGFLEADHLYELEVLAIEQSGNQTISVGFFRTD